MCNFNQAFQKLTVRVTGEDKYQGEDYAVSDPPVWNYNKHFGYTKEQDKAAWDVVHKDPHFWADLKPYPDAEAYLGQLQQARAFGGHPVYFITSRPGVSVNLQTEYWLAKHGYAHATVLVVSEMSAKGYLARGLKLTHMIEDNPGNAENIKEWQPSCKVSLLERRYNTHSHIYMREIDIPVIASVSDFITQLVFDAHTEVH